MSIDLIVYNNSWIATALARQFKENLEKEGLQATIVENKEDLASDTCVHFFYFDAVADCTKKNILYVTHIDHWWKAFKIMKYANQNCSFICMSRETKKIVELYTRSEMVYHFMPESINFKNRISNNYAQKIRFGLFFRNYSDGRKNNLIIDELFNYISINKKYCQLIIYGEGFEEYYKKYKNIFLVYDDGDFNRDAYEKYLKMCDYILYFGFDEGAYCTIDASIFNIPIIVTNQGYHRDIILPIGSELHNTADQVLESVKKHIRVKKISMENKNLNSLKLFEIIKNSNKNNKKNSSLKIIYRMFAINNNFIKKSKHIKQDVKMFIKKLIGLIA
jgi:hypothetical protein